MQKALVYGIGNPLIDITINISDEEINKLGLSKGTMLLIDLEERKKLLKLTETREVQYSCGGSAPNTIISLSSFGIPSVISGKIGNDEYGKIYQETLQKNNILSDLRNSDGATGSCVVMVTPDSERTMNTYLGTNRAFSLEDVNEQLIKDAEYFYFTGYMWDTENQKTAIERALETSHIHNTKVIFDVADPFSVQRYKDDFLFLIKNHVDIVFANREEAKILCSEDKIENSLDILSGLSSIAVVKNGSQGSFIKSEKQVYEIAPRKVNAIDTTGAGDMYAAGFIYGLSSNLSLKESGMIASFLASEVVCQHGAQFSKKKLNEIKDILKNKQWKNV